MSLDYSSTRTLALTLSRRAIADIHRDGLRQLRNYVDMCTVLVSSPTARGFFDHVQAALEQPSSPYYALAKRLIDHVSPDALCTVGVNFGLGSMLYGSALLERQAVLNGRALPWLTISAGDDPELEKAVETGERQGGFLWMLHQRGPVGSALMDVIRRHPQSTFQLLIEPEFLSASAIGPMRRAANLVVFLWLRDPVLTPAVRDAVKRMRAARMLCSLAVSLDDQTAAQIADPAWLREVAGCVPLCCCMHSPAMSDSGAELLRRTIWRNRVAGGEPVLLLDWQADIQAVDCKMPPHTCVAMRRSLPEESPLRIL